MSELVRLQAVSKVHFPRALWRRGGVRAVDRVSMAVRRGRIFGLVGESGCGKTSLGQAISGLDPPTSGEVWYDGENLGGSMRPRRMQYVFQDPAGALDPRMRVGAAVDEGVAARISGRAERRDRVGELLETVGLSRRWHERHPHELSGGQKQRVVLARALAMEPEFLILDEPVSSLDASVQAQIINLLRDLQGRLGLTYLFISHDLNLVGYLCDDIAVMYRGRIVELGAAEAVLREPLHPYTRRLFSLAPSLRRRRDLHPAEVTAADSPYPIGDLEEAVAGHFVASHEELTEHGQTTIRGGKQ